MGGKIETVAAASKTNVVGKSQQKQGSSKKRNKKKSRLKSGSVSNNFSAGSGANIVMARRKLSNKSNARSRGGGERQHVLQAGLPGWNGPAGSSLKRNSSYASKAEAFSFAKPNLQLQLVSGSRSIRHSYMDATYKSIDSPINISGRRGSTKSNKSKSARKKSQQRERAQTPMERWQSETETIIKRLNQIRIQQGHTLRIEQESKKGKEMNREKRRWRELMQREQKRERKLLKR